MDLCMFSMHVFLDSIVSAPSWTHLRLHTGSQTFHGPAWHKHPASDTVGLWPCVEISGINGLG